jgi:CDP-diacylglycerol--glycerol-3-phosphate 3-phosphatidyltransferase
MAHGLSRRAEEHIMSLYGLKPRFQGLLRPLAAGLARRGITANQVTVAAALGSLALGGLLSLPGQPARLYLALAAWLAVRLAFNAIDGMLAREFGQQSRLGAYLNELGDALSDAALLLPFAFTAPFSCAAVFAVMFLALLSEYAGVMGPLAGAGRRYDGPLGKSDRAMVIGVLAVWIGFGLPLPGWVAWLMPALAALLAVTLINRVLGGLRDA